MANGEGCLTPFSDSSDNVIRVAIVGAAGYTGLELVRLLVNHPNVTIVAFFTSSTAGDAVVTRLPFLRNDARYKNVVFSSIDSIFDCDCDVMFFATPNGVAMKNAEALLAKNKVIIDLGADFRLKNADTYRQWYGEHTAQNLLSQAVYGLSEAMRDDIKSANLIACPGCYATTIELALIPLFANNLINGNIIVDAKSGVSGAGKKADRPELLMAEMYGNYKAYATQGHRHLPEIQQTLQIFAKTPLPSLTFVPHLLPIVRGIYANLYIPITPHDDIHTLISDYWADAPFINVLPLGSVAEITNVAHSNYFAMSLHPMSENMLMICATLDNLVKGAAGQAVQNMNIRYRLPEKAGLNNTQLN